MEKKENKTMKKGLTIAALALLLGIVGYTGGNTFAKYISNHEAHTESATVAKWGLTCSVNASDLFGKKYGEADSTNKLASVSDSKVVVSGSSKVVAPGTTGSTTITLSGQADVDASVTFESKTNGISLTGNGVNYDPIVWSITLDGAAYSHGGKSSFSTSEFNAAFASLSLVAEAPVELDHKVVISWAWEFETGDSEAEIKQNDVYDTYLGLEAAGKTIPDDYEADVSLDVDLNVTFTQIQSEA